MNDFKNTKPASRAKQVDDFILNQNDWPRRVLYYMIDLGGIVIDCSREDNYFLEQLREKEQTTETGAREELLWKRVIATLVISNH